MTRLRMWDSMRPHLSVTVSTAVHGRLRLGTVKGVKTRTRSINLLDGNPYSYWSSYLSPNNGGHQDSPSELPYYVVIDMGKEQTIDGFYYANGDARCISGFTLQTTDASGFGLEQHGEQEWRTLYVLEQTLDGLLKNEQFIDFPQPVTARYLRLVFDKPNLFVPNEGDEENFEKFHKDRQQMFSEFGTFFYKR